MHPRDAINRQLTRQGLSRYALAKRVAGHVPASTIYGFLRGEHTIGSDHLAHLLDAAGLKIVTDERTASAAKTKGGK